MSIIYLNLDFHMNMISEENYEENLIDSYTKLWVHDDCLWYIISFVQDSHELEWYKDSITGLSKKSRRDSLRHFLPR